MRNIERDIRQGIDAVLAANEAFYRAFEKRSIDAMSEVWSKGTGCLCVHPGRGVLMGWDNIHDSWEQIFHNTHYLEVDVQVKSSEISGSLAVVVVVESIMQVVGARRLEAKSIATNVFERMGASWFLIHHHGSPLMR
ncbi:MAG: nuclear transport factor 2 family protein [Kaiparowitsia implicata GSE-PSE-MK54-09C]|jgi:ketosteroid isomerase-like protein|nr:nuclear transport factor 2 family protein [Kaiparowitsia implicata GSE-PSE-MK54-09C]